MSEIDPEKKIYTITIVRDLGDSFLDAYLPIARRRMNEPFTDNQRQYQLYRRGRYVEFNLLYDRGTIFGLETRGRTESILMSLPPIVRWVYDFKPEPGSAECNALEFFQPRDWIVSGAHASPIGRSQEEK